MDITLNLPILYQPSLILCVPDTIIIIIIIITRMFQLPATAAIEYVAACCITRTRTITKTKTKTGTKTKIGTIYIIFSGGV